MSNLGIYQWATTTAKKFGGMEKFLMAVAGVGAGAGAIVGVAFHEGGKWCIRKLCSRNAKKQNEIESKIYSIHSLEKNNNGIEFAVGDQFRILETDGDAVLIEKISDSNNPYFVSVELLHNISDYNE